MEWMLMPLKRYADFSGRSRRKEYWMFVLFQLIIIFGLLILSGLTGGFSTDAASGMYSGSGLFIGIIMIFALAMLIPSLAVQVRRFHDQDKSGWFILLSFVPFVGGLIVLVFMCLEGTQGPNRFGEDPKMSETVGDVFN